MRIVIQRVAQAAVAIHGKPHASIGPGFLVLLGIGKEDSLEDVDYLAGKVCGLRVFGDAEGKMNLDIRQVNGGMLVISQFTLHASTRKGNRPSFINAADPAIAIPLYEAFIRACTAGTGIACKTGVFGANMQVSLVNDGPVTIVIDSKTRE
jgi:D-aminoacyl-tRNA deacylase